MSRLPSLTARLVLTVVGLVLAVSALAGTIATLAVQHYLTGQLDDDLEASLERARFVATAPPPQRPPGGGAFDDLDERPGQAVGTLTATWDGAGTARGDVVVQTEDGEAGPEPLTSSDLSDLRVLTPGETPAEIDLEGFGTYRVAVAEVDDSTFVAAGLPTADVSSVVSNLVVWQVVLISGGALLALGAGVVLVRRNLRPLREVAGTAHTVSAMPLAEGEIALTARVPDHLVDERTEVGRVAAALNALLAHVEGALDARHRSEHRVRQFVGDASHELRTPLATIAGYTELARRHPDDQTALRTALAKVEEESARMTTLVEDLLLLARLDSGRPPALRPVDLTRLLLEAVADVRVLGPEHQWRLDLPESQVTVSGDEQQLHQVVTNLLTNARKYTPPGTTVTVAATPEGFSVHDTGPGFSAETAAHAFERFTRGDVARHRAGGVGLGLALVQAIVSAHGGTVELASRPGDTTLTVRLPRAAAGAPHS